MKEGWFCVGDSWFGFCPAIGWAGNVCEVSIGWREDSACPLIGWDEKVCWNPIGWEVNCWPPIGSEKKDWGWNWDTGRLSPNRELT